MALVPMAKNKVDANIVNHYRRALDDTGNHKEAVELVVTELIVDGNIPDELHRAHGLLIRRVIAEHEARTVALMQATFNIDLN